MPQRIKIEDISSFLYATRGVWSCVRLRWLKRLKWVESHRMCLHSLLSPGTRKFEFFGNIKVAMVDDLAYEP